MLATGSLGRNLRHLILLLDELHAVGVAFVEPGRRYRRHHPRRPLQLHVLGAIAEFERERIQRTGDGGSQIEPERKASDWDGRGPVRLASPLLVAPCGLLQRCWGVSKTTAARWIATGRSPIAKSLTTRRTDDRSGAATPLATVRIGAPRAASVLLELLTQTASRTKRR